jgi:hypothetical protein
LAYALSGEPITFLGVDNVKDPCKIASRLGLPTWVITVMDDGVALAAVSKRRNEFPDHENNALWRILDGLTIDQRSYIPQAVGVSSYFTWLQGTGAAYEMFWYTQLDEDVDNNDVMLVSVAMATAKADELAERPRIPIGLRTNLIGTTDAFSEAERAAVVKGLLTGPDAKLPFMSQMRRRVVSALTTRAVEARAANVANDINPEDPVFLREFIVSMGLPPALRAVMRLDAAPEEELNDEA